MRYLSICSGIEAASVAWHPLGWTPVGFAEIEPFPSAVLAHHYPGVPNLGDMTKFKEWNVEDVDLLVGGTPCQAFSVAGLRGGLSDSRGNLTLTFVEMADYFDPNWVVWENVPGVLSSKDNAFGCFLAGLVGASEPLVPDGRWDNAGLVSGPRRTVAWRVLDAQFFGVAQRRRRVFVCAVRGSGNWSAARALFSVGESVYWDSAPRREKRQSVAGTIEASLGRSRGAGTPPAAITAARMVAFGEYVDDGTASAMKALDWKDATDLVTHAFKVRQGCEGGGKGYLGSDELASTLSTHQDQHIAQPITFGAQMSTPQTDVNLVQTLQAKNPMAVAQPIALQDVRDVEKNQNGRGWNDDGTAYTVDTHATQGVAQPVAFTRCDYGGDAVVDGTPTMRCGSNYSAHLAVAQPVAVDIDNCNLTGDCTGNILAGAQMRTNKGMGVMTAMQVRRLTPTECERLQGFPDGYTNIPWRNKPEAPDGPRYKALGNSMAVPVMHWIGKRINNLI